MSEEEMLRRAIALSLQDDSEQNMDKHFEELSGYFYLSVFRFLKSSLAFLAAVYYILWRLNNWKYVLMLWGGGEIFRPL